MLFDPLTITINLLNEQVQFAGSLRDNPPITVDYTPPIGGGEGYTSLELFLMSFATCAGTSVLLLLRKKQKIISGFSMTASGVRREQHPTCFARITLDLTLHSPDVTDSDIQHAFQLSEDAICPVWAMIKGNVEVVTGYHLISPEANAV